MEKEQLAISLTESSRKTIKNGRKKLEVEAATFLWHEIWIGMSKSSIGMSKSSKEEGKARKGSGETKAR